MIIRNVRELHERLRSLDADVKRKAYNSGLELLLTAIKEKNNERIQEYLEDRIVRTRLVLGAIRRCFFVANTTTSSQRQESRDRLATLLSNDLIAEAVVNELRDGSSLGPVSELIDVDDSRFDPINVILLSNDIIAKFVVEHESFPAVLDQIIHSDVNAELLKLLSRFLQVRGMITDRHISGVAFSSVSGHEKLREIMRIRPIADIDTGRVDLMSACLGNPEPSDRAYDLFCLFKSCPTVVAHEEVPAWAEGTIATMFVDMPAEQTWHIFDCQYVKDRLQRERWLKTFVGTKVLKHPLLLEWRERLLLLLMTMKRSSVVAVLGYLPDEILFNICQIGFSREIVKPPVKEVSEYLTFSKEAVTDEVTAALEKKMFG